MSYVNRRLVDLANEYMTSTGEAVTTREIARWALKHKRWDAPTDLAERRLAEEIAAAMRAEYHTDAQGRPVRSKHVARRRRNGKSEMLWDDIRRAPRKHMEISFTQRRDGIVGDCRQLKCDVDSFNDNRAPENPIQMSFNFTNDLAELEAARLAGEPHEAA
jgi:hypothetical protein